MGGWKPECLTLGIYMGHTQTVGSKDLGTRLRASQDAWRKVRGHHVSAYAGKRSW